MHGLQRRLHCHPVELHHFLPILFIANSVHWIGFLLDELLFPGYRKVAVRTPLFIVGVPRSGTSYLHRVIAQDSERFTTLKLWELLLAPSICERRCWLLLGKIDRRVGAPFTRLIRKIEQAAINDLNAIHPIGRLGFFDNRVPDPQKKRIVRFYRACLKRHLYGQPPGQRLLSKTVSFAPMVSALNATFPDCKIICNVRHPLDSIPSHISSMTAGAALFGNDGRGSALRLHGRYEAAGLTG